MDDNDGHYHERSGRNSSSTEQPTDNSGTNIQTNTHGSPRCDKVAAKPESMSQGETTSTAELLERYGKSYDEKKICSVIHSYEALRKKHKNFQPSTSEVAKIAKVSFPYASKVMSYVLQCLDQQSDPTSRPSERRSDTLSLEQKRLIKSTVATSFGTPLAPSPCEQSPSAGTKDFTTASSRVKERKQRGGAHALPSPRKCSLVSPESKNSRKFPSSDTPRYDMSHGTQNVPELSSLAKDDGKQPSTVIVKDGHPRQNNDQREEEHTPTLCTGNEENQNKTDHLPTPSPGPANANPTTNVVRDLAAAAAAAARQNPLHCGQPIQNALSEESKQIMSNINSVENETQSPSLSKSEKSETFPTAVSSDSKDADDEILTTTDPKHCPSDFSQARLSKHLQIRQQKALAEQRRREAVKATSIDMLARENLRVFSRMNAGELNQSKSLVMCFLSGEEEGQEQQQGDGSAQTSKKEERKDDSRNKSLCKRFDSTSLFVDRFQRMDHGSTKAYHYRHDPSQPLPKSLLHPSESTEEDEKHDEEEEDDYYYVPISQVASRISLISGDGRFTSGLETEFDTVHNDPYENEHNRYRNPQSGIADDGDDEEEEENEGDDIGSVPSVVHLTERKRKRDSLDSDGRAESSRPRFWDFVCDNTPEAIGENVELSESETDSQSSVDYSAYLNNIDEEGMQHNISSMMNDFKFIEEESGGCWMCKNCIMVPPPFQSEGAISNSEPNIYFIAKHRQVCLGKSANLSKLVESWLTLTTNSTLRFHHLITKEFKAIIRVIVNENEDFVTLLTDDVRKKWLDPIKYATPTTQVDWSVYPFRETTDRSKRALAAFSAFARAGTGFDFVKNESFVQLFALVAPDFNLPSPKDLIEYW